MKTIDITMSNLKCLSDNELINLAKKYLQAPLSNCPTSQVESVCEKYNENIALESEIRSLIAMFIAFEELTRSNQQTISAKEQ